MRRIYNNIISSNEFEFLENKEWKQSYQFIDKAKLVMTIYSALGLESLAREIELFSLMLEILLYLMKI